MTAKSPTRKNTSLALSVISTVEVIVFLLLVMSSKVSTNGTPMVRALCGCDSMKAFDQGRLFWISQMAPVFVIIVFLERTGESEEKRGNQVKVGVIQPRRGMQTASVTRKGQVTRSLHSLLLTNAWFQTCNIW